MRLGPGLPEIDLYDVRHSYATAGRDAKISSCHMTCESPWLLPIADRVAAAWLGQMNGPAPVCGTWPSPARCLMMSSTACTLSGVMYGLTALPRSRMSAASLPGLPGSRLAQ